MKLSPKALEVRRRLRDDFAFYASSCLRIRTKDADISPLVLNEAQRRFVDAIENQWKTEGKVRIVVLKARQMGLSTVIGAWLYWRTSQNQALKTLVMAHKADATSTLFEMTKRFHDLLPDPLRSHTKYSSKRELTFDILQSSFTVATAGGDGVGRSETLTGVHASEVAFWPKSSASDVFNGLTNAVPNMPGTAIFVESTANGVSGKFAELWQGAIKGENGYVPIFLPWHIQQEYRRPVPDEGLTYTPEELELIDLYGLDDEQLQFRRVRIAETSRDQFKQEYPSCAEEAFLTSGMPVFNPEQITEALRTAPAPVDRLTLEGSVFVPHSRGQLAVYKDFDPARIYYIGADVAEGIKGRDYSVAQVIDDRGEQAAVWRGHVHPDYFAVILKALGERYGTARIIPERNNHGILTCSRLAKDLAYPNVFMEESVGNITEDYRETIGFSTNVKTKPLVIDQLRAALRDGVLKIRDRDTLQEMLTYIVTETGKMEAEEGHHDDCVMALALAFHIFEAHFDPVANADEYYVEVP